ncbi:hypothetical protein EGW08_021062, partial [Elysia chlorotica]
TQNSAHIDRTVYINFVQCRLIVCAEKYSQRLQARPPSLMLTHTMYSLEKQPVTKQPTGGMSSVTKVTPAPRAATYPAGFPHDLDVCNSAVISQPGGLEALDGHSMLYVVQQVELLEAISGFETANKYEIQNRLGQKILIAAETSSCCFRRCCGSNRPFTIEITDLYGSTFMYIDRPLRCSQIPWCCCLQKLTVESPRGRPIGYVLQECSFIRPVFRVESGDHDDLFRIKGPWCMCKCCGSVKFKIKSPDGQANVGIISKDWAGLMQEMLTDADKFGVTFPESLAAEKKATLLAAVFLIDFLYFEDNSAKKKATQ